MHVFRDHPALGLIAIFGILICLGALRDAIEFLEASKPQREQRDAAKKPTAIL